MNPAIIIPVYNHPQKIAEVIKDSLTLEIPVFVVDDGSDDETATIIKGFNKQITILHHPENRGKGAALCTGFSAAADKGHDYAITIDGDGQHLPEDALSMLADLRKNLATNGKQKYIVVGTRTNMYQDKNVPWTSSFGRKFSNFWVWAAGGPLISDSQSGFRIYPLPEVLTLEVRAQKYQFEVEVLVKAKRKNITIISSEITSLYPKKNERVSHFRPWLDFWRNSLTFNRLVWQRVLFWLK